MDIENYDTIWKNQIKPALQGLEDERRKAYKQRIWIGVAGVSLVLAGAVGEFGGGLWLFLPLGVMVGSAIPIYYHKNEYSERFKKEVFAAVAKASEIEWKINPRNADDDLLSKNDNDLETATDTETGTIKIRESKLYPDHSDVSIDDVLVGRSEKKTIPVWETTVTEGHGRSKHTVFSGFFLEIPVDYNFDGETYVRTQSDDTSDLGEDEFMGMGGDLKDIKLEWSDFETFLVVKSSSRTEPREIFTPDFMQVLYDWWHEHDKDYRFAFHGQSIYITFPALEDLEPSFGGSIKDQKSNVKEIFFFIAFIEELFSLMQQMEKIDTV
jgi:hypothetical protein